MLVLVLGGGPAASAASAAPAPAPARCDAPLPAAAPEDGEDLALVLREQLAKDEYRIPMRDGAWLYAVAFIPRDQRRAWPVMMLRAPCGVSDGVEGRGAGLHR